MKTYRVKGYCLVPTGAHIEVTATDEAHALRKAKRIVGKNNLHKLWLDGNDSDGAAAFGWEPLRAVELKERSAVA